MVRLANSTRVDGGLVKVEMHGFKDASAFLWGTRGRAKDLRPVWPAVGDVIATSMHQQFTSAGAAGGRPWKPLNPDYLSWKIKNGYDPRTLVKTGAMMQQFTSRPMGHERHLKARGEFGVTTPYYKFHHLGTKHMSQRRVLFSFEPHSTRIARKVGAYIAHGVVG